MQYMICFVLSRFKIVLETWISGNLRHHNMMFRRIFFLLNRWNLESNLYVVQNFTVCAASIASDQMIQTYSPPTYHTGQSVLFLHEWFPNNTFHLKMSVLWPYLTTVTSQSCPDTHTPLSGALRPPPPPGRSHDCWDDWTLHDILSTLHCNICTYIRVPHLLTLI